MKSNKLMIVRFCAGVLGLVLMAKGAFAQMGEVPFSNGKIYVFDFEHLRRGLLQNK